MSNSFRTCVQICFHVLKDEINVSVVFSFQHIEQPVSSNMLYSDTYKTQPTNYSVSPESVSQKFFIPKSILKCHYDSILFQ